MNAIEVRHLVKRYRSRPQRAVDDVSFDVADGQLFCLLGPNGAGKTTTVSILTTTLSASSGRVRIAGRDLASEQAMIRREVGIVFQGPSLDLNLTAEENVRLHAVLYGLYPWRPLHRLMPRAYRRQVGELAEILQLADILGRPARSLSGGTRRKLEIVRALMHHPRVLFLDEPTAGLDPESRRSLWSYLFDVRARYGTTVFLTTHYLEEAETAESVGVLVKGRLIEFGSPAALKSRHARPELVVDAEDRGRLRSELVAIGVDVGVGETAPLRVPLDGRSAQGIVGAIRCPLTELRITEPTLEETYLRLLGRGMSAAVSDAAVVSQPGIRHEIWAFAAIAQRDVTKLWRDRLRLCVSLAFPFVLIVGLGNELQPTVGRATGLDAVTLTFTGVLAATMFQSAAAGMISVVEDRENDFSRELFVTPVSRLTLVSGKIAGETLVALCQGVCIIAFAVAFGVPMTLGRSLIMLAPCLACCLLGAAFGLATLAALANQRVAMQVFQFLIIPQYVLAGVFVPPHALPTWLDVVSLIMPLRYGVELARACFYARTPAYHQVVTLAPLPDLAVMVALFLVLVVTGALVFDYRERTR